MADPALFIGVVSHANSRFAVSRGPEGLAARLAAALPDVAVQVNTKNPLDEATLPVTGAMLQASLSEELHLDRRWAQYLGRPQGPRWWAMHGLRWARREWRRLQPPPLATMRRLLNIELSHLDLMRAGLDSGAAWVLVLEDDALAADITDLADGLAGLMATQPVPAFVNISESFALDELGIDHLLQPVPNLAWAGPADRALLQADRPVTNTVCAILYSAGFLADLVAAFDDLPMDPVVPIDWKLNVALMTMHASGVIPTGSCWLVEPAPITQMSMRPTGIMPP